MTVDQFIDNPLGPEDAKQRRDIEESFVDITHLVDAPRIPQNPAAARIVVGRKGSGKTHILRHIERMSQNAGKDVTFCSIESGFLDAAPIYRSDHTLEDGVFLWTKLWQLALNAAVFSHFNATSRSTRFRSRRPEIAEVRSKFPMIHFDTLNPFNPVAALTKIRQRVRNEQSVREALRSTDFDLMEQYLGNLLQDGKSLHFIIDGLDELSWMDPRSWLAIQLGLYQLAFLHSHTRSYLRRVHLTISLRNYVYSHALRHPHSDRIGAGSGLVKLIWDQKAAQNFLDERLLRIRDQHFARSDKLIGPRPLASWLGFDTVKPARRKAEEPVEQYLLRHTRCAPRQVISVLNHLCLEQNRAAMTQTVLDPTRFGEIVAIYARSNADLMVKTAAEELLSILNYSTRLPEETARRQNAIEYFLDTVSSRLGRAIAACGNEVCETTTFREALYRELGSVFMDVDRERLIEAVEGTLWRSCIFAYPDMKTGRTRWKFAWSEGELGFKNPRFATNRVGLHPTLIDLCDLEVSEDGPVF